MNRPQMLMTSSNPALLRELVRLLAVLVACKQGGGAAPSDALVSMIVDDVLLNQIVCIFINSLDEELVTRTSVLLNNMIYYQPRLVALLVDVQMVPIVVRLAADPSMLPPAAVPELVRLMHSLSVDDTASALMAQQPDAPAHLLSLLVALSGVCAGM